MNENENEHPMKHNQRALKHGGEGAIRRISEGKPLLGLAAEEEKAVTTDLAEMGIAELEKQDAIRLQSALNLYWSAIEKAAQDGDLIALDRYVARFGWLAGVTLRAWAQVTAGVKDKAKGSASVIDVLNSIRKGKDETSK